MRPARPSRRMMTSSRCSSAMPRPSIVSPRVSCQRTETERDQRIMADRVSPEPRACKVQSCRARRVDSVQHGAGWQYRIQRITDRADHETCADLPAIVLQVVGSDKGGGDGNGRRPDVTMMDAAAHRAPFRTAWERLIGSVHQPFDHHDVDCINGEKGRAQQGAGLENRAQHSRRTPNVIGLISDGPLAVATVGVVSANLRAKARQEVAAGELKRNLSRTSEPVAVPGPEIVDALVLVRQI